MVAAEHRQVHDPRGQQRGDAGRPGRAEVDEVVAAFGQRFDDRRQRRHADLQPGVERDLDLGDRAEAAVGDQVGRDDLDLEARHAAVAQLLQRVRDAMHPADAVGDQRDAARLVFATGELGLLLAQEGRGRRVGDRRDAGVKELGRAGGQAGRAVRADAGDDVVNRAGQLALMGAAGAAEEVAVAERVVLHRGQEIRGLQVPQLDRIEPGAQQRAGVARLEIGAHRAAARVALAHDPLDHPQDGRRVEAILVAVAVQRADGQRHRGVRPLCRAALVARRVGAARADVRQELLRRFGARRLGPRAADVDPCVVIRATDAGATVRLDVDERRQVQFLGPRAVAHLPRAEELREPAAVARRQRGLDGVEGVRQRAGDVVLVKVLGDRLHAVADGLQVGELRRRDAKAQHMDRLRLLAKPAGQLHRDEDARVVGDLQDTVDRVVIGDRHEVHAARQRELQDLLGRGRAFGQPQCALDAEL